MKFDTVVLIHKVNKSKEKLVIMKDTYYETASFTLSTTKKKIRTLKNILLENKPQFRIVLRMKNTRNTFPALTEASAVFYCCEEKPGKKSLKTKRVNKKAVENKYCEINDGKIGREVLFINSCYYVFIIL